MRIRYANPLYPAHCEAISHEPDTIAVERIKRDGALPLRGMELPPRETRRATARSGENSLCEPLRGMELIDTDTSPEAGKNAYADTWKI